MDLCRAVARRQLGSSAAVEFLLLASPADYERVRDGSIRLAFLTPDEIAVHRLAEQVGRGPVIAEDGIGLVTSSPVIKSLSDLRGQSICFIIGTEAETRLDAWFAANGGSYVPRAFQELDERDDALASGQCVALVDNLSALEPLRIRQAMLGQALSLLAEPLSRFPVIATVPTAAGPRWTRLVADAVAQVVASARERAATAQAAVQPPSSDNSAPVIPRASSETR